MDDIILGLLRHLECFVIVIGSYINAKYVDIKLNLKIKTVEQNKLVLQGLPGLSDSFTD